MKSLKNTLSLILTAAFLLIFGCSKQESPQIVSEEVKGAKEIERLEACSKVNFNTGVLLYQNMLQMFVCTKWNEEFPNLFKSMKKMSASSWDHIITPFDQAFIENQQRRDRFFRNIHELDDKNGLDDLSYVLVALNETNFFDSLKALFTCADNPLDPICMDRTGRIAEKKSLKNIIKLIDTNPETIENVSLVLKSLISALDGNQESLRTEINKLRASPLYISGRLRLIDTIASKIEAGYSEEDREFLAKVFLTGNSAGDTPWLHTWIQNSKLDRIKFRDLLEFPILVNPEFISEFKGVKSAYDDNFSCSIKNSGLKNDLIEFDLKTQLFNYAKVIQNESQKRFFEYSTENLVAMKLSTEICKELEVNKYKVNLNTALTHFAQFMGEKNSFELVKFLVAQTTATGDQNKTFAENIYLADLVTGNIFSAITNVNSNISKSTRDFYPVVFDVLKKLPAEGYLGLGEVAHSLGKSENDEKSRGIAHFWNFFSDIEKNFLFNFLDRHFDKDTQFVLLFDFYTKFLDDFKEVQPLFKESWTGSFEKEEMSYLSLQDIITKLDGDEALSDFRKFFSRNQILKVLEVISNGRSINKLAKEELEYIYSDNYVIRTRGEPYKLRFTYKGTPDDDFESKEIIECMQKFSEIEQGIYSLIRKLPASCQKVTNATIAFKIYGWLNSIEENYLAFKKSTSPEDSLLDKNGLLSPYMINSTFALSKIIDELIGPLNSAVPTKNGLSYSLESMKYYLNDKKAAPLIDKNLQLVNSLLNIDAAKNTLHRNTLIKSFTRDDNFTVTKDVVNNVGVLFTDYGKWIKSGELARVQNRNLGTFDPNLSCEKVINQVVTPYPCPSKEAVKLYGGDILYLLQNKWGEETGSPVALLLKAVKPGNGLEIPLNGKKTKKVRISLRDVFRYMYDSSDKSFEINNKSVKYVSESGKTTSEKLTTLERIESVIREVRFDNNYLGVAFLNAVVHGDDYNSDVANRKKLLQKCVKIPKIRCARKMSDSDLRMALNSLEVFDSLSDINNGRGLDPRLKFGDFLKTFETALVASSLKEAQKVQTLPLKDEVLVKHNGKILSDMTLVTAWSNTARVIRDRVGRTRKEFEDFLETDEFKRVDKALLYGFELPVASVSAERLISKLNKIPENDKQTLFANTVDWITTLSYDETRLLEDTIARAMVVGSYLGTPEVVFEKSGPENLTTRYQNNNVFQIFLALEKIVDYWPVLKNYFPADAKLIDVVKPVNTFLYYFTTKLSEEKDPRKNTAYLVLNDLFLALQTSVFEKLPSSQIGADPTNTTQGIDFILGLFKDSKLVEKTYSVTRENYRFIDNFHQNNGQWFSVAGQNLQRMANSPQVDLAPLVKDYLAFTSKNLICSEGSSACKANYHHDEPANLLKFLNKTSSTGQSNFMLLNQRLFVENFDQFSQMLDELLPSIRISKNKSIPLR